MAIFLAQSLLTQTTLILSESSMTKKDLLGLEKSIHVFRNNLSVFLAQQHLQKHLQFTCIARQMTLH